MVFGWHVLGGIDDVVDIDFECHLVQEVDGLDDVSRVNFGMSLR